MTGEPDGSARPPGTPPPASAEPTPLSTRHSFLVERGRWAFEHLPGNAEWLLDAGCHDGAITSGLASRARFAVGIDVDVLALRAGRVRHPHISFVAASADALPFPTGAFDCVLFSEVLEHVPAQMEEHCIGELRRVLRSGGTLLLTTPHHGTFWWLDPLMLKTHARRLAGLLSGATPTWKGHKHYTVQDVCGLLGPHFEVQTIERRGWLLYPLAYWGHLTPFGVGPALGQAWRALMDFDYSHEHGDAAYNLCIVARAR